MKSVELVRQWGGSSTDAVLDKNTNIFETPLVEGFIGYRLESDCAVVFGDPICDPKNWEQLTSAFCAFNQKQNQSIVFVGVSKEFTQIAMKDLCEASIAFGEELSFDPAQDPRDWTGNHGSLVRRKVRQATKEKVSVEEYKSSDLQLEKELEQVSQSWLASRSGPQIHISHIHLFENRLGKRWFYAKKENQVVGLILLNELKARKGWLINHLMITPEAPHGTPELLFISVLEALKEENCHYATVGAVPSARLGEIEGLNLFSSWIARTSFLIARRFFRLDGRSKFWEKFHPQGTPTYLLFKKSRIGVREILGILQAANFKFDNNFFK